MRIANSAELSTAAVGACDVLTDDVGNSGCTKHFILRGHLQFRQSGEVRLVRRESAQARTTAVRVVPDEVLRVVGVRYADAVVGLRLHPLVPDAAPRTLDEHVVSPGASPGHRQLAARHAHRGGEVDEAARHRDVEASVMRTDEWVVTCLLSWQRGGERQGLPIDVGQSISSARAMPWPPPMQRVTMPRLKPSRRIECSKRVVSTAPVAPMAWP